MTNGSVRKVNPGLCPAISTLLYKGAIHAGMDRQTCLVAGSHPHCKSLFSFRNPQLSNVLLPELFHNFPCN